MKREETVIKTFFECDGCQYTLPEKQDQIVLAVPWAVGGYALHFHFHPPKHSRHDCFRYWAHNPSIMRRSLKARGLTNDEIDQFMTVMLYKDEGTYSSPGVERETL